MNILRLSTLSLILAIAVITLGYAGYSSAAPPCSKKQVEGCRDDSGDGEGKTETVFLVEMQRGGLPRDHPTTGNPLEGVVISNPPCGSTEGELHLGAVFRDDCAVINVCFMSGPTGCGLTLHLWYVQVNLNKSNVKIWFRADNENNLFVTDHLAVTIIPDEDESSSAFTVEVNEFDLTAERNHNPGKGDLVGFIAIGNIVYTPVD